MKNVDIKSSPVCENRPSTKFGVSNAIQKREPIDVSLCWECDTVADSKPADFFVAFDDDYNAEF